MPEWLQDAFVQEDWESVRVLGLRLVVAFVLGCAVAMVYRFTHLKDEQYTPSFITTLVLLTVLIALVTRVIGDNLARAFGLVGALSIIRFRTVVEDTRDTAFVIFAVVIGMAAGAGYRFGAVVGLVVVSLAAFIIRPRRPRGAAAAAGWHQTVRVGVGSDPDARLTSLFGKHLSRSVLVASATGRQGAAIDLTYQVAFLPVGAPAAFVQELNQLPGVQGVELRRD
jgi:cell division protein FtsW (lipid II flippase)